MGRLSLPSAGAVYVDTNTVIYAVEKIEPYASFLDPLWFAAGSGQLSIISSGLIWLETITKPLKDGSLVLEQLFRAFLTSQEVTLKPATLATWEQAARLRALGLKTPDALHAATGLAEACALFLTNDRAFQRVTALPVTVLTDAMAI